MNVCYNMWFTNVIFLIYPFVTDKKPSKTNEYIGHRKDKKTASFCNIDFLHIPGSARGETGIWLTILRHLVELPD